MSRPDRVATQSLHWLPTSLTVVLGCWGLLTIDSASTALASVAVSYLLCDWWLWSLHCYLDRKECLQSWNPEIRLSAALFQEHHDFPGNLLHQNHIGDLNDLVLATAAFGVLVAPWSTPSVKLGTVGYVGWGLLAGCNHFYCHARTHQYSIPDFYRRAQDWGLLPSAGFHKKHHTAPHEEKWSFLCGFGVFYELLHRIGGQGLVLPTIMFALSNPIALQTVSLIVLR